MKDIKAILDGFDLPDETKQAIIRDVTANYRTIAEVEGKTQRIAELERQNETLTEQVGNLEGDGEELEALRKQVQEFTDSEAKRKAEEQEIAEREAFRALFNEAVGEREFVNDLMRDTVFEKAYGRCKGKTGASAKDAIEELTKDTHGIWVNPQTDPKRMPGQSEISNNKDHDKDSAERVILNFMAGRH